jgi:hypothetical protein
VSLCQFRPDNFTGALLATVLLFFLRGTKLPRAAIVWLSRTVAGLIETLQNPG